MVAVAITIHLNAPVAKFVTKVHVRHVILIIILYGMIRLESVILNVDIQPRLKNVKKSVLV